MSSYGDRIALTGETLQGYIAFSFLFESLNSSYTFEIQHKD